jgi:hypothetical protein
MRRRECLMAIALLTITLVSVKANPAAVSKNASRDGQVTASEAGTQNDAEESPIEISAAPSPLISEDKTLAAAYFNTLSILSTTNGCSLFFGGPAVAIEVFKHLISKVQKDYFTTTIGIQMSGETITVSNATTKTAYRLFDKVRINTNGPFYRKRLSLSDAPLRSIGTFQPNTKEARVLMFLHELGHVMKGEDGNWLLPNDGKDENISRLNSQKIEGVCGEQIKALPKHEGKGNAQMTFAGKTYNAARMKREAAPAPDNKRLDQGSRNRRAEQELTNKE